MASFDFTVDTTEMARSVDRVARHVDGTTAAVVGMQAAVIKAEKEGAESICHNVNRGFHHLILSQISQRGAKAKSVMEGKLLELRHQSLALRRIKAQMERDFHRIASRYSRLFNSLNETLKNRVFQLDEASFTLSGKEVGTMMRRSVANGPKLGTLQIETVSGMQLLAVGRARRDSAVTLKRMQEIIARSNVLKSATKKIIQDMSVAERRSLSVPLIISETDDLRIKKSERSVFVAGQDGSGSLSEKSTGIKNRVLDDRDSWLWREVDSETKERLRGKCMDRAVAAGMTEREQRVLFDLLEKSCWLSVGGARG